MRFSLGSFGAVRTYQSVRYDTSLDWNITQVLFRLWSYSAKYSRNIVLSSVSCKNWFILSIKKPPCVPPVSDVKVAVLIINQIYVYSSTLWMIFLKKKKTSCSLIIHENLYILCVHYIVCSLMCFCFLCFCHWKEIRLFGSVCLYCARAL